MKSEPCARARHRSNSGWGSGSDTADVGAGGESQSDELRNFRAEFPPPSDSRARQALKFVGRDGFGFGRASNWGSGARVPAPATKIAVRSPYPLTVAEDKAKSAV